MRKVSLPHTAALLGGVGSAGSRLQKDSTARPLHAGARRGRCPLESQLWEDGVVSAGVLTLSHREQAEIAVLHR